MKKATKLAVNGKVRIISKLAPREKTIKPIDEAAIKANQLAKSFFVKEMEFSEKVFLFLISPFFFVPSAAKLLPKIQRLKTVKSPKTAEPNRAENSETPKIL